MKLRHLDLIKVEEVKNFIVDTLEKHNIEEERINNSETVIDIVIELLKRKQLFVPEYQGGFVSAMVASAYLHNIYFSYSDYENEIEKDWTKLFKARMELFDSIVEYRIPASIVDAIFQTIEAQLGDLAPINALKANPGTPQEIFSTAVYIANNYKRIERI